MFRILLVDDEPEVRQLLKLHLEHIDGYVTEATSGHTAIELLKQASFELIILDLMMDEGNGFDVLHFLQEEKLTPIVITLSARREIHDKITVLGLGADDYVTKPFSPIELVARVQAQLRRHHSKVNPSTDKIRINKLILDLQSSTLFYEDKKHWLTAIECELLHLFMRNADRVLTKRELYQHIWKHDNFDDNNLSVFISRLRKILERTTGLQHLHSVRGIGYRFSGDGR